MNWNDVISIGLSLAAIAISCLTSLLVVSPHVYIHALCEAENKYVFLLIVNNGFSPGLLFTDFGIAYRKKGKLYFVPIKNAKFNPNLQLHQKDMELFWSGNFFKQISPENTVFLVLDRQDVCNKLKEIASKNVMNVRFYLSTSSLFKKGHTKKIRSQSYKVTGLIKNYERSTH